MKKNIIHTIYAIVFLAGMFGLFAVAESNFTFTTSVYIILGIFAVLYAGAKGINKLEKKEEQI